jgi:asparagine synthase (glutamine-hydrolysing)
MCGIAGCVAFSGFGETHHALMRRMCGLIAHRGPDDEGFHVEGIGGLGHRRLSIIDLSGGKQPMGSADGQVWLAFNGEIYNYMEVRADLEKLGHRFRTRSDTEVILEGYRAYGPAVAEKLNGMFAYAIWDAPRKRLVLSRDRLGKKPLYYSLRGDSLIFASELKSLLADPSLPREVDPAAVDAFFTYGFVPSPGTILKGIHKLRPGHTLVWEGGDLKVTQYWNVRYEALQGRSEEEWVDAIQDLLEDSVRIRLMSEVPLGAFLSGGLDSSLVVGTMRKLMAGGQVKTFTIGFGEGGFSEVEDARRIAKAFATDHREFEVRPETAILPELAWYLDEPFGDSSAVPTYYVSRMARQEVTVVLSGDGGDEAFAGYNRPLPRDSVGHPPGTARALGTGPAGAGGRPQPFDRARRARKAYQRRESHPVSPDQGQALLPGPQG